MENALLITMYVLIFNILLKMTVTMTTRQDKNYKLMRLLAAVHSLKIPTKYMKLET